MPDSQTTGSRLHRQPAWKSRAATLLRCGLVISFAVALRLQAEKLTTENLARDSSLTLDDVQAVLPQVVDLQPPTTDGLQTATDNAGNTLLLCHTLPRSADIIGYRSPADVLLVLDPNGCVVQAELLFCNDTADHVDAVRRDSRFWDQFRGWCIGAPRNLTDVDATSGATLTALAIAESVAFRLSGRKPSLRFPDPLNEADLQLLFPERRNLELVDSDGTRARIVDAATGKTIGRLLRTGPLADQIAGYQGPSELLVLTGEDGRIQKIRLRRTYENQPYAGYLNEDDYFWTTFLNRPFHELRNMDLVAEQVEGVSGATMTSMAVAETLIAAAEADFQNQTSRQPTSPAAPFVRWTAHDTGTICVLACALLIGMSRLRARKWVNRAWLIVLILYFGLVTGNLISLAVLFGWAAQGMAWRLAPGLAAVVVVSLLTPPLSKRNIYCTHLCPHGALQQLIRRRKPAWPLKSPRVRRTLRYVPGIILAAAAVVSLLQVDVSLSAWEPFQAWVWTIAGPAAFCVAGISLLISTSAPLGWCRYGCGTGRLLEYLRHNASAAQLSVADMVALSLNVAAWMCYLLSP